MVDEESVSPSVDDSVVDENCPLPFGTPVVDEKVVASTSSSTSVAGDSVEGETEASVMEESVSTSVDGSAVDENC